jgi:hypothetical protein
VDTRKHLSFFHHLPLVAGVVERHSHDLKVIFLRQHAGPHPEAGTSEDVPGDVRSHPWGQAHLIVQLDHQIAVRSHAEPTGAPQPSSSLLIHFSVSFTAFNSSGLREHLLPLSLVLPFCPFPS